MSLGQWFRDYVYFPLGGSRVTKTKLIRNLFGVWVLTGIWHGASWNFVLWGLMYFILISFEKLTGYPHRFNRAWQRVLYRIFTLICIVLGWVLFRAWGTKAAVKYSLGMFGICGNDFICPNVMASLAQYWVFFLIAIVASTPIIKVIKEKLGCGKIKVMNILWEGGSVLFYMFILIWSVSFIMIDAHNPFIYFNF